MTPSERLEKKQKIDNELTRARTELAKTRRQREAMAVAERRGDLIEKKHVIAQAAYLMIAFRQRVMNLGVSWARRFVGLSDVREAKKLIDEMARSTLTELAGLPQKVSDPGWLETLEGDGEEPEDRVRPASGQQIKAEQAGKTRRRQNKTATDARRRAREKGIA